MYVASMTRPAAASQAYKYYMPNGILIIIEATFIN